MKTKYFIITALLCSSQLFAQMGTLPDTKGEPAHHALNIETSQDRATPFWTEDFGSGFPSDWVIIDSSGICPWTFSTDGSWGFWSDTGEGSADPALNSTTGGNGFLICDVDSANHVNYGQPSQTTYSYLSSYFGTSVIDCSPHSTVVLSFEQSFKINNSVPLLVQVSTDSTNWTTFEAGGSLPNNINSDNPDFKVIDITSVAANSSTVYLRFGWSCRVYWWMIDDINLSEADAFDVAGEDGYWEGGTFNYQYYKIPLSQVSPITFYGSVSNYSGTPLTDVYFDVDVDNGGNVFSGTSNLIPLAVAEMDTANVSTTWTPSAVGTHDITYTAGVTGQTDANLTNNDFVEQLEITDNLYGLDNLPADGSGYTGTFVNWSGNVDQAFGAGNLYEILADDEIECMEVGLGDNASSEGNLIFGAVYWWDGGAWALQGQTDDYIVASSDLGAVVSLNFNSGISVSAGQEVLVLVGKYGGPDIPFMFAQGVPEQMVYGYNGIGDWFYLSTPSAMVVRANFSCGLSTKEIHSYSTLDCYPNPASDMFTVDLGITEAAEVTLSLLDINGKQVVNDKPQQLVSGQHQLMVETKHLEAGVYTVRLKLNDSFEYRKIVVE